jgi:hypothetical protein
VCRVVVDNPISTPGTGAPTVEATSSSDDSVVPVQ